MDVRGYLTEKYYTYKYSLIESYYSRSFVIDEYKGRIRHAVHRTAKVARHILFSICRNTVKFGAKTSKKAAIWIGAPVGIVAGGAAGVVLCMPVPSLYSLVTSIFLGTAFGASLSMFVFGAAGAALGGTAGACYGLCKGSFEVITGDYDYFYYE